MGGAWVLQRLSALQRRGRTQIWLAVVGLVVLLAGGLALFVFARQPHVTSQTPSFSSAAVLTALAEAGTAAASATEVATLSPAPRATLAPTPKLALTCAVQGATTSYTHCLSCARHAPAKPERECAGERGEQEDDLWDHYGGCHA
jgi:hypothetical protein